MVFSTTVFEFEHFISNEELLSAELLTRGVEFEKLISNEELLLEIGATKDDRVAYACRLTRMCESEVPCSQNYRLNIKYPLSILFLHK